MAAFGMSHLLRCAKRLAHELGQLIHPSKVDNLLLILVGSTIGGSHLESISQFTIFFLRGGQPLYILVYCVRNWAKLTCSRLFRAVAVASSSGLASSVWVAEPIEAALSMGRSSVSDSSSVQQNISRTSSQCRIGEACSLLMTPMATSFGFVLY